MWVRYTIGDRAIWQVDAWKDFTWFVHGFTTRLSGNMAFNTEEEKEVLANRQRLAKDIGFPLSSWVTGNQVHGDRIAVIGDSECGKALPNTDGLATDRANVFLASFYADCVPLLFVDPTKKVVALAHAGWRGTAQEIGPKTVKVIRETWNCSSSDIQVGIGPSIGPCCYQVGAEVANRFPKCSFPKNGELFLDLKDANKKQLLEVGIEDHNVFIADLCTACHDDFFSYRKEQTKGRMMAFIGKKGSKVAL